MSNTRHPERGTGAMPTVFGLAVLIAMVGLASNVAIGLWHRTTVESVTYEAARAVATADPSVDEAAVRSQSLERACDLLGARCREVQMHFVDLPGDSMVQLHVQTRGSSLLPAMVAAHGPVVGGLDRTIRIRRERP